jgi:hypothetical protein
MRRDVDSNNKSVGACINVMDATTTVVHDDSTSCPAVLTAILCGWQRQPSCPCPHTTLCDILVCETVTWLDVTAAE